MGIYLLTLLAFTLNALIPFLASYDLPVDRQHDSVFGDKILICSGDGFKLVKLADLQQGNAPEPDKKYKCALCYTSAHGQQINASSQQTTNSLSVASIEYSATYHTDIISHYALQAHIRAPPAFL